MTVSNFAMPPGLARGSHASAQGQIKSRSGSTPAAQARASILQRTDSSGQSFGAMVSQFARANHLPPTSTAQPGTDANNLSGSPLPQSTSSSETSLV